MKIKKILRELDIYDALDLEQLAVNLDVPRSEELELLAALMQAYHDDKINILITVPGFAW